MKNKSIDNAASLADLQALIAKWPKFTEEQVLEYKDLGITKRKLQNQVRDMQTAQSNQAAVGEADTNIMDQIQYETMWTDMQSYIADIITDLKRHENIIPELADMISFYQTSMIRIDQKPTQVLKRLSAQLMTQLYNLNLSTFLAKHAAKKAAESEELAPDAVGIGKDSEPSEQ